MARRNPPAKWNLPTVIDPAERLCIQVPVPNDRMHIAAFRGALLDLASAYKWADDVAHTAREVALVWRDIIDGLEFGCGNMDFDVRQNETEPCTLEKTVDGETWTPWADLQLCPPMIRINNGIVEYFNGSSWVPLEEGDERESGTYDPPWPDPPVGQNAQCLSAANMTAIYQTSLTQIRAGLEAGLIPVSIAAGVTGLMSPFIPGSIFAAISLSICSAAFALGIAGLDDMLQTDHLENFQCALYCHMETDGTFTASGFNAARAAMADWATSVELYIIQTYLDGLGSVGLNRQGAAGGVTAADCLDCCPEEQNDWHIFVDGSPDDVPNFTPWTNTDLGGNFTSPFGLLVSGSHFTQNTGSINEYGAGTAYHLAVIVTPTLAAPLTGVTRVYGRRLADNPNGNHSNQFITRWSTRYSGAWNYRKVDVGAGNSAINEEVVVGIFSWAGEPTYDRILIEFGSYPEWEITRIVTTPT